MTQLLLTYLQTVCHTHISLFTFCEMTQQNATFWSVGTPGGAYDLHIQTWQDFCTMRLASEFHCPTFNHSEVIVLTNNVTLLKTPTSLRYTTPVGNRLCLWCAIHDNNLLVFIADQNFAEISPVMLVVFYHHLGIHMMHISATRQLRENMTASTKSERKHINVSQSRQRKSGPRPYAICTSNLVKFGHVVFELCKQTDRQMDKPTNSLILPTPLDKQHVLTLLYVTWPASSTRRWPILRSLSDLLAATTCDFWDDSQITLGSF